ncbi:MAG: sterol desaturase family protein, partial [Pseudomonadota bacterium]
ALFWRQRGAESSGSFFSFLFPAKIYTHPSVWMDVKLWVVIALIVKLGLFGVLYQAVYMGASFLEWLLDLFWVGRQGGEAPDLTDRLIYTLVFTLCIDFGFFIMHYCQHKIAWLWAFHKVHHSAAVLTPITANRHHPVDYVIHAASAITMGSIATVLFTRLHGTEIDSVTLFNTSAIHFFYYMTANLRHSHLWLSFGPLISRLFVSPAMHQIHHSIDARHYDRNFGFVFSIWDWLFRCRYIPTQKEDVQVGLLPGETPYRGFLDMMWRPFPDSLKAFSATGRWRRKKNLQPHRAAVTRSAR